MATTRLSVEGLHVKNTLTGSNMKKKNGVGPHSAKDDSVDKKALSHSPQLGFFTKQSKQLNKLDMRSIKSKRLADTQFTPIMETVREQNFKSRSKNANNQTE